MIQQSAIDLNINNLLAFVGLSATYTRGNPGVSCSLTVAVGRSDHTTDTEYGVMTTKTRDYVFRSDALVLSGQQVKPQVGDTIEDLTGVYQVVNASGSNCYEHPDPLNHIIRVHTQQISE